MTGPLLIERIEARILDIPTIRPHKLSFGAISRQSPVIVQLWLANGAAGFGEAACALDRHLGRAAIDGTEIADNDATHGHSIPFCAQASAKRLMVCRGRAAVFPDRRGQRMPGTSLPTMADSPAESLARQPVCEGPSPVPTTSWPNASPAQRAARSRPCKVMRDPIWAMSFPLTSAPAS